MWHLIKVVKLKAKIKKYKAQIEKLKEKIRSQNVDIEEALKRLSVKFMKIKLSIKIFNLNL